MASLARFRKLALALDPGARRIRREIAGLAAHVAPAECVLDLGSGDAPYADLFRHRSYVTADLFAGADVRCDAMHLPFRGAAFDLVICTEVLEHVPGPDAVLQEIRRVMTGGGTLILTTPLTWGVHAPQDYHRWTRSGLVRLLAGHGFEVDDCRARGGVFLVLAALLLVIPWQVLGEARERRWWQTALFTVAYPLLVLPALVVGALDGLDRRQHFTLGYVVRCRTPGGVTPARSAVRPLAAAATPAS